MEKPKVYVSFVEKAPGTRANPTLQNRPLSLAAPTLDSQQPAQLQLLQQQKKCQLIGILREKNSNSDSSTKDTSSKQQIAISPRGSKASFALQLGLYGENAIERDADSDDSSSCVGPIRPKIPRPANAFMLFANEWRKKLAVENPRESNKDISVRLGVLWKTMSQEVKEKYFATARQVDAEHKRKYPDYVYNPKEARLRKAMRDQNRELSRTTTTSSTAAAAAASPTSPPSTPCTSINGTAAASRHQVANGNATTNRMMNSSSPWFPLGQHATSSNSSSSSTQQQPTTHPKPILSPRVMAAHQRTLDKTEDVIRKQLAASDSVQSNGGSPSSCDPPATSPTGYHHVGGSYNASNINGNNSHHHHQHPPESSGDYCDFAEAQKWHPYQNGVSNAYHSRSALMSKMNSLHGIRAGMPAATSPWAQFCNVPFPSQSAMMRSNRHMLFLQEQQQQQCGYPDEMMQSYEAKMQQDELARMRLHSSPYSQDDQRVKSPLSSLAQLTREEPTKASATSPDDTGPRWSTPRPSSVSSSSCTTDTLLERETDSQQQQQLTTTASKPPPVAKQPLPGFQQAFGSTEIGKFSRSELFASLVEAANSASHNNVSNCISNSNNSGNLNNNNNSDEASPPLRQQSSFDSCSNRSSSPEPQVGSYSLQQQHQSCNTGENSLMMMNAMSSCSAATTTMPRWHSPYAGAIGSDI